jgi:hypothetical protein
MALRCSELLFNNPHATWRTAIANRIRNLIFVLFPFFSWSKKTSHIPPQLFRSQHYIRREGISQEERGRERERERERDKHRLRGREF